MGRKKEGKEAFTVKMQADKKRRFEQQIIGMGFYYERNGARLPSFGRFLEAIESGDIVCFQKISVGGVDNEK